MKTTIRTLFFLLTGLLWSGPFSASAQVALGNIVYTVGTVTTDSDNRNWAYIAWQPITPGLLSNEVFAVYSKPGGATSTNLFTRLSLVQLQTDPRVIEPLIRRAANLGDDTNKLEEDVQALFSAMMPSSAITRAQQISAILRGAQSSSQNYQALMLLARNHPAIDLALGYADAEMIGAGLTTFEVRGFDPVAGQDLAVIGRVTLQVGEPVVLPAPGPPVLIPDTSPMGDLNLRFRWGTPDDLRLLSLLQFGYDLFRVSSNYAANVGWNETNLPPVDLLTNLAANYNASPYQGDVKRVNNSAIIPVKIFEPDAVNLMTGDTNTSFIMDDDGRGAANYVNYGFTNGAMYYYYVAARDILGRDGSLSTGLLATVCDRMPPYPPTGIQVLNEYHYLSGYFPSMQVTQQLRVVWNQNTQTNDTVLNYYVYRWTNLAEMNLLQANPANGLIGIVSNVPGAVTNSLLDTAPGSPSALGNYDQTYWYTVRAADAGACGANLSFPGGPAFGVLHHRNPPQAGAGRLLISCVEPDVIFSSGSSNTLSGGQDPLNCHVHLQCSASDPRLRWAEFYGLVTSTQTHMLISTASLGRFYFPSGPSPSVSTWWNIPVNSGLTNETLQVYCQAALDNGQISPSSPPQGVKVTPAVTLFTYVISNEFGGYTYVTNVALLHPSTYTNVNFLAEVQTSQTTPGPWPGPCSVHDCSAGDLCVLLDPSANSREYRLYQRVDQGPLTMVASGAITNSVTNCFPCPVNAGVVTYYGQWLDSNANPSSMEILGSARTAPYTPLPVPVLNTIQSTGNSSSPGMNISWFCPPPGVQRFELIVGGNAPPPSFTPQLSALGPFVPPQENPNTASNFFAFKTPVISPAFGSNGVFSVQCSISPGTYSVQVCAVDQNGGEGGFSTNQTFSWSPANPAQTNLEVPWPALGLPTTNGNFVANAAYLSTPLYVGNAFQIGMGAFVTNAAYVPTNNCTEIGNGNTNGYSVCYIPFTNNPNSLLFVNNNGVSIFPCALYRYQTPNANFPVTSGTVVQVSPLMEEIACQINFNSVTLLDPFITLTATNINNVNTGVLWLKDNRPVIAGAAYQYILAHFDPVTHEIDQLIPSSNEVQVP